MELPKSLQNESLIHNNSSEANPDHAIVTHPYSKKSKSTGIDQNLIDSPKSTRKRERSQDYLTAQGHVQVDPIDKHQNNSKSKRKILLDRKNVDISRVCPITPPMSPNTRQHQQRIKEDYITASGHVHVEGTNGSASITEERVPSSYKHVDVVPLSQTRQNSDKNSGEHVLVELIDEDDLFRPLSNRIVESDFDDEIDEDDSYSVVYVNEDEVQVLDCVAPPQHTDVQLVPRHQSPAKILQHRQRNVEKAEYLTARGHVDVGRPKKKKKKITPIVEEVEYRLAPRRRINVLVLEPDSDASPPMKQRNIKASPRIHQVTKDELNVSSRSPKVDMKSSSLNGTATQSDLKMNNIHFQLVSPNAQRRNLISPSKTNLSTVHPAAPMRGTGEEQGFQAALKTTQKSRLPGRPCCWWCLLLTIIFLLASITALILALILVPTVTTTTTTTTTTSVTTTTTTSVTTTTTTSVTTTTTTSTTSTTSTSTTSTIQPQRRRHPQHPRLQPHQPHQPHRRHQQLRPRARLAPQVLHQRQALHQQRVLQRQPRHRQLQQHQQHQHRRLQRHRQHQQLRPHQPHQLRVPQAQLVLLQQRALHQQLVLQRQQQHPRLPLRQQLPHQRLQRRPLLQQHRPRRQHQQLVLQALQVQHRRLVPLRQLPRHPQHPPQQHRQRQQHQHRRLQLHQLRQQHRPHRRLRQQLQQRQPVPHQRPVPHQQLPRHQQHQHRQLRQLRRHRRHQHQPLQRHPLPLQHRPRQQLRRLRQQKRQVQHQQPVVLRQQAPQQQHQRHQHRQPLPHPVLRQHPVLQRHRQLRQQTRQVPVQLQARLQAVVQHLQQLRQHPRRQVQVLLVVRRRHHRRQAQHPRQAQHHPQHRVLAVQQVVQHQQRVPQQRERQQLQQGLQYFFFSATICGLGGRGQIMSLTGQTPLTWTLYRFNITANLTRHTVIFGFQTADTSDEYYFDTVSVTNVLTPGTELLTNPGFESSTSSAVGWSVWCSSGCGSNNIDIRTDSRCFSGNCIVAECSTNSIETLAQSFTAVPGNVYTVSFRLIMTPDTSATSHKFFFDFR